MQDGSYYLAKIWFLAYGAFGFILAKSSMPDDSVNQNIILIWLIILCLPPFVAGHIYFYIPKSRKLFNTYMNGFIKTLGLGCLGQILAWIFIMPMWKLFF